MYEKRRINTARQRAGYVHHLSEVHTICQKRPGCMTRDPYKRPKNIKRDLDVRMKRGLHV